MNDERACVVSKPLLPAGPQYFDACSLLKVAVHFWTLLCYAISEEGFVVVYILRGENIGYKLILAFVIKVPGL